MWVFYMTVAFVWGGAEMNYPGLLRSIMIRGTSTLKTGKQTTREISKWIRSVKQIIKKSNKLKSSNYLSQSIRIIQQIK